MVLALPNLSRARAEEEGKKITGKIVNLNISTKKKFSQYLAALISFSLQPNFYRKLAIVFLRHFQSLSCKNCLSGFFQLCGTLLSLGFLLLPPPNPFLWRQRDFCRSCNKLFSNPLHTNWNFKNLVTFLTLKNLVCISAPIFPLWTPAHLPKFLTFVLILMSIIKIALLFVCESFIRLSLF